jgi:hypothetical protein
MRTTTSLLLAALAALPGCACDTVPADAVQDCSASYVLPGSVATDILFVIDDSGSMSQEQANLSANLGAFIDSLALSPVDNDFRIGVTSTSVEEFTNVAGVTSRAYGAGPSSGVPYPAGALVAIRQGTGGAGLSGALVYDATLYASTAGWGGRRVLGRTDPDLARAFKANVLLGLAGSGKEQPFRAVRLALTDRLLDANQGFLRPGARLAVVIVTDEDDCSDTANPQRVTSNDQCHDKANKAATPPRMDSVEDFSAFLFGPIDGELRDVTVGVIAGFSLDRSTPPVLIPDLCRTVVNRAVVGEAFDSGDRFAALLASVGGARMQLGSICDPSFSTALEGFAALLMPSSLPLQGVPADWRMLAVALDRKDGTRVSCAVAAEGTPEQAAAGAVYSPPAFGRPALLTFQQDCALGLGDRIDVRIVCVN